MRKPKLKKYPKKPKSSAGLATLQRWMEKKKFIDAYNTAKIAEYRAAMNLRKTISGISQKHHNWGTVPSYTRKPSVKKHKRRVSGVKRKKSRR